MDSINKHIGFVMIILYLTLLCSCTSFEDKLCDYMEHDQPDCPDTTYWQTIDLQKVLNIEYDRLYIVGGFEKDIRQATDSNWDEGDFLNWDENLLLLVKGYEIVYQNEISNSDAETYYIDQPEDNYGTVILVDSTSVYNVRVDICHGVPHYYLYNKKRMDNGKVYRNHMWWFRNN